MRVMAIVKATRQSEAGEMPGPESFEAMGKFNQELIAAGVMLDGAGLHPSSKGARIAIAADGTKQGRPVTRGPFQTAPGELISGYWIWKVETLDEAIAWAQKCPSPSPGVDTHIELRPLFEEEDFKSA